MLNRIAVLTLSALALSACSGESADAPQAAQSSAPSALASPAADVDCAVHYSEVRDGILGALRGSEVLPLVSVVTTHSEGVMSAPTPGTALAQLNCNSESRSFRAQRAPSAGAVWSLAPECDALILRLDTACLKPLAHAGTPFSAACNLALMGVASASDGQQQNMSNASLCQSAMSGL